MKIKPKYYGLADLIYYKRLGGNVWFTCRKNGTNEFYKWQKKYSRGAKTWIETMEKHPSPNNPKPISLSKLKKIGINP